MIIKLHPTLVNKIAAGEVVERPASVLKELMENAIDAKATKISANLQDYGNKKIEMVDNGTGMSKDDAIIACDSHTTSKISTLQDLEDINSMGFRGEALASISAVSRLTLISKPQKDKVGTKIQIDSGKVISKEDTPTNKGTTIAVERLFHIIPARKKFLKSKNTEYKHLLVTFFNYALAFPNIHFSLSHNNKTVYNLPSMTADNFNDELLVRINDLFGSKISSNLVEIHYSSPYIQIGGFVGHPSIARSQRSYQLTFLNKRPISDKLISRAVYDAYQSLIPKGKYPIFFLFINLDPRKVDVNVHPRKSEVRFERPDQIYQSVKQAAKGTLLKFLQKDTKNALKEYSKFQKTIPAFKHKVSKIQKDVKPSKGFQIKDSIKFTEALLKEDKDQKFSKITKEAASFQIPTIPRAFQVFNNYIIIERKDTLLVIDQHAASERVTYESFIKQTEINKIETQRLLIGEIIELNKIEFAILRGYREQLSKLGLKLSIFGKSAFKVEEIPALIAKTNIKELIANIVSELEEETRGKAAQSFEHVKNHIIETMACHSSIRSGMKLHVEEIKDLVEKLLKCNNPYSCPHGRPIIWKIERSELEKKFKRH